MCTIVAALGAALSVAQSVVSFAAASEDYNNRKKQYDENRVNAIQAGTEEQKQLSLRMIQEQDAFAQKNSQANIEGAEVAAEAEVSAASAGVSGISLDNILRGVQRKVGQKIAADRLNHQNTVAQIGEELKATTTTTKNRINSVQVPTKPNPFGYILQGIGGGLSKIPA